MKSDCNVGKLKIPFKILHHLNSHTTHGWPVNADIIKYAINAKFAWYI